MRRYDFNGSPKTVAASGLTTFTPSDIPGERVVAYHIFAWGNGVVGNEFDTIDRIRVKANGVTRFDVSGAQLGHYVEKVYPSNPFYNSSFMCWTIPFYNTMLHDEEEQDTYQFEPGANPSVEIQWGAGAEAGTAFCGWTQTNVPPKYYMKYYGQQLNIANGAVNGRFNLSEAGGILGIAIPQLGLTQLRLVLNGTQWLNLPGTDYTAATQHGLIGEMQRQYTALTPSATVPVQYFIRLAQRAERAVPATPGQSYVELNTSGGGAWAGTANEIATLAAVPV